MIENARGHGITAVEIPRSHNPLAPLRLDFGAEQRAFMPLSPLCFEFDSKHDNGGVTSDVCIVRVEVKSACRDSPAHTHLTDHGSTIRTSFPSHF